MKQLQFFADFSPASEKPAWPRFSNYKLGNYTNAPAARAGRSVFAVSHICQFLDFHWWSFDSLTHNPGDISISFLFHLPTFQITAKLFNVNGITSIFNMSAELSSEQVSTKASEVWWLSCFKPSKEFSVHFMRGVFIYQHSPKLFLVILHFHQHVQTLVLLHHE